MTISGDKISKRIGQGLALAAILAYWAPVVGSFGSQVGAYLPMSMDSTLPSKNTTVAYEIIEHVDMANTVN
ncbi:MAG: hypothetical protein ABIN69_02770 [Aestuariivirga sp.]